MKVNVIIKGVINVPDEWLDPDKDGDYPLEIADERYNRMLTVGEAIFDLAKKLEAYPEKFNVTFDHMEEEV